MAFEQGTGVLKVLFGVGFGGSDAVKRFVEDADDPLLFGKRRDTESRTACRLASCNRLSVHTCAVSRQADQQSFLDQ